jgi:hypothetical protein
MVLVTIDKQYQFPTMLSEISIKQYIELATLLERELYDEAICSLLKIEKSIYDLVDLESKLFLVDLASLLLQSENIVTEKMDLHELIDCPIGQFEDWKASVAQETEPQKRIMYLCLLEKGAYDYDERMNERLLEFLKLPASVVIYYQNIINEQLEELKSNFLPLFNSDVENIHEEAGINTLLAYGGFATLYELAGGIYKDIERVSKTSVGEAYTFLSYKKQEDKYLENLRKLKNEEAIRNNKIHRK